MAVRKIVKIDESKCDGCGACVPSCAEGAIQVIDGKAKLVSEIYCDGLGACLGTCPRDAITIEERDAQDFSQEAADAHVEAASPRAEEPSRSAHARPGARGGLPIFSLHGSHGGCPGSTARELRREPAPPAASPEPRGEAPSQLSTWPVQLHLMNPSAPFLRDADLLFVADCVPFAYADFHAKLLRGNPVIIGCPKLDDADAYVEKLAQILSAARPRSITVVRMEVPCCGGLNRITQAARAAAKSEIPVREIVIGISGRPVAGL